ncbi:DUF6152 family protein [Arthrobacter oryzae]|uniref:DUF6152 family protein n=1 Tax=Arthrobacter oryzae TaxID=409290 RepID=UPI0030C929D6
MRIGTITGTLARTSAHPLQLASASLVSATMLLVFSAGTAQAHHGFDDFDTARPYYIAGTVSEVRWGEPHSYFTVTIEGDLPADTPELPLPEQLQAPEDSGPINQAPSYSGSHEALEVTIAPPSFTGRWGLDRPLVDGERVEAVGYIGRSHNDEFRPVVFWFEDGRPVNQVLGSQLPATPLPAPYPDAGPAAASAAEEPNNANSDSSDSDSTSPIAVWAVLGGTLVAIVAGGAIYLRARSRRA